MRPDICLFDFHKKDPRLSEVMGTVKAFKHAFPEYELLMDGDRYGIFARRKVSA